MNIPYFHVKVILPTNHGPISLGPTIIRARFAPLSPVTGFSFSIVKVFRYSPPSADERAELTWFIDGLFHIQERVSRIAQR